MCSMYTRVSIIMRSSIKAFVIIISISLAVMLLAWNLQSWNTKPSYYLKINWRDNWNITITSTDFLKPNQSISNRSRSGKCSSKYDWSEYYTNLLSAYKPENSGNMKDNCSYPNTILERIEKVLNYPLKDGEIYWNQLSLGVTESDNNDNRRATQKCNDVRSDFPVFVTAANQWYFSRSQALFKNIEDNVRVQHKNMKLIFYDIGLNFLQKRAIKFYCLSLSMCELRTFDFNKYPDHVRNLKGYTWKPIIIQEVIKDHDFVFWVDSSIRILGDLTELIARTKERGIQVLLVGATIAQRTSKKTFKALDENVCYFEKHSEIGTGAIAVIKNNFTLNAILRPWTRCALTYGCMDYDNSGQDHHLPCDIGCHRFDQSVLGIILFRIFYQHLYLFTMDFKPKLQSVIDVDREITYPLIGYKFAETIRKRLGFES